MLNHNIPIGDKWHNSDMMPQWRKRSIKKWVRKREEN